MIYGAIGLLIGLLVGYSYGWSNGMAEAAENEIDWSDPIDL